MAELPTGTVTFLFTDIEGSTAHWEHHPEVMAAALARHDELLESAIDSHDGVVFSRLGDGLAAAFASPRQALAGAVAAQRALTQESWPEPLGGLAVRMGLHTGEGTVAEGQYLNQPLNRCARLMAIGSGGQILVSSTAEPLVRGDLPDGVGLVDLGEQRLRDLSEPMCVFQVEHRDLPAAFPPLRSLDASPGNLPLQVSSFIGRQRELARVVGALDGSRVVTLTGVGGIGKTRLALQVAAELLPSFRDGAWLVELAPVRDRGDVASALASVLGVSPRSERSLEDSLVEFLRTKQLLLVVDNCEHLLEPVAAIVELLERSCPGVVILATSREGLALEGERMFAVPSLDAPTANATPEAIAAADSVSLFVERAQRVDIDFGLTPENAPVIARICRRLDGVPLAIELAAARVRAMNPTELARGLDHRFETLAGGRRRAVRRHQTLRTAIDWSYDLLSEPEQRLLARLAVFVGGCTREAAEVVCGIEPIAAPAIFELMVSLVDRSLVVAERDHPETRYRLLETIREYGEERLVEHGEADLLRDRHAEFHAHLLAQISEEILGPTEREATKRINAEQENVIAAVKHAIDTDQVDLALQLVRASPFMWFELGFAVWILVDPVLGLTGAPQHPLYPYALAAAAWGSASCGDLETAVARCEEAALAAERLGDPGRLVEEWLHFAQVMIAVARGAHDEAGAAFEETAEVARAMGRISLGAQHLGGAAAEYSLAGDSEAAIRLATEGLALARQVGMPSAISLNLTALAGALADEDPEQAQALLHEGVDLRKTLEHDRWSEIAHALFVSARLDDWSMVLELAPEVIRLLHWAGARPVLSGVVNVVARAVAAGDPETAAVLQGAARNLMVAAVGGAGPSSSPRRQETGGNLGLVTELRRETTGHLVEVLGEPRLRELRAQGQAMDADSAVPYALEAVAKVQTAASS